MSKFSKLDQQDVVVEAALAEMNPVEEGWGIALGALGASLLGANIGTVVGAIISFGILALPGAIFGAFKGYKFLKMKANQQLKSILHKEKMEKYIIEKCDEIFKKAQKENKNLTTDIEASMKKSEKIKELMDENRSPISKFFTYLADCSDTIGKYTIMATGDTDSFEFLWVLFYDTKDCKVVKHSIPVPSAADLK